MYKKVFCNVCVLFLVSVLVLSCGKPAEQTAQVKVVEKEYELPAPENGIATTSLLKLTPDLAQVSLVLPSIAEGVDKLVQLAKKFYTEEEVNNWVQKHLLDLANFAGTPEAKNLIDIAQARGFDITVPVGAFIDVKPSVDYISNTILQASSSSEGSSGEPNMNTTPSVDLSQIRWEDVTQPNWALAMGVLDKDKVIESLKELVVEIPEISATAPKEENVEGIKIINYGPYAYFIMAKYVVVGSTSMVKGIAERFAKPYPARYGTQDLPASSFPEGVILVKDWVLLPMISTITPTLVKMSPYAALLELKISPWKEMLDESVSDPIYLCFSINPQEQIQFRSMIDLSKRPKYLSILGEAQTLYLPTLFPDMTQASIVFQLTKEYKTYLTQTAVPKIKSSLENERSVAQAIQYGSSGLGFIGSELGLCVTGAIGDFPAAVLAIRVANIEQVTGLLNMLVPTMEEEVYREIPFKKVAVPSPIPITMVMVQDLLLAGNNVDVLKKMVDLVLDKGTSNYLASLSAPVDNSIPRYSFISLQSKLFLDTVFPLMSILGKDLGDAQDDVQKVLNVINEVRLLSDKKGNLLEGKLIAFLKPPTK